jgi:hypothetical protein
MSGALSPAFWPVSRRNTPRAGSRRDRQAAGVFALDVLGVLFAHHATAPSRDEATLRGRHRGCAQLASLLDLVTPRFGAVPDIDGEVERFMARLPPFTMRCCRRPGP